MAPKKAQPESKSKLPESIVLLMKHRKAEFLRGSRAERIKLRDECTKSTLDEYHLEHTDEIAYKYFHMVSTLIQQYLSLHCSFIHRRSAIGSIIRRLRKWIACLSAFAVAGQLGQFTV